MKPLRVGEFEYLPRKAASLAGMEASITEQVHVVSAGKYHFREPYSFNWEKIKEDEVTQVHAASFVEFEFAFVLLPIEVIRAKKVVANLQLRANSYSAQWQGHAVSFLVGRDAIVELERALADQPWALATYQLDVPSRGKIGFDGTRFFSERAVARPTQEIPRLQHEFAVVESALKPPTDFELKKRRFTGSWPPISMLEAIPNWVYALDEETRSGQDETTIKPANNQRTIDYKIAFTAGEAWFPDGQVLSCLIGLDEGEPFSVICFGDTTFWQVTLPPEGSMPIIAITAEQITRFPVRVVSRLSTSARSSRKTIRFALTKEGRLLPWKL